MMQRKKIARLAIVGEAAQVVCAKNPSLAGISGTITDETRNTITIKTTKGAKTLIKDQISIKVGQDVIEGGHLIGRVEERIKKSKTL